MDTLPQAKFCKNRLRGYILLWKIYTKNYHFWRFWGAVGPHFKSRNGEVWHEGAELGLPRPCQIL